MTRVSLTDQLRRRRLRIGRSDPAPTAAEFGQVQVADHRYPLVREYYETGGSTASGCAQLELFSRTALLYAISLSALSRRFKRTGKKHPTVSQSSSGW